MVNETNDPRVEEDTTVISRHQLDKILTLTQVKENGKILHFSTLISPILHLREEIKTLFDYVFQSYTHSNNI